MSTDPNPPKPTPAGAFVRRWLQAVRRTGSHRRAPLVGRLAVDALPDEWCALEGGKLYAIYAAARTPGADALIWESAREARARDVTVVLARERAQVARRLRELGFSADAPASGWPRNLSVLAMPPAGSDSAGSAESADAAAHGPAPVALAKVFGGLRALKRFGFRSRSLYFVEGAERWFSWDDPVALAREGRMLANWCAARNISLVLLLGSPSDAADADQVGAEWLIAEPTAGSAAAQPGRNEFHAACSGVARMERTHGELLWHVDFWRSGRTLVTGEVRSLRFTESGRLSVAPDALGGGVARGDGLLARDEQRVVVSRAVVRGHEAWVPPNWEVLADQNAVLAACAGAQAATVVLDYAGGAQLEALCAAVHALRRQAGRALKIVIVERGEVLRHQYELLVLTLGANLVLGRDLPFSRVQSLLQSLQGQLHTRPIAADYRSALSAALSDAVLGYLPFGTFCERVRAVLERSAVLQLPHVLVRLTLLPQSAHVEALRSCVPRRAGDIFTADAAHLYVFLFACRLADADAALARIFEVPVERFAGDIVHLAEQSIDYELKLLEAANRRMPAADYSDLFAAPLDRQSATPSETASAAQVPRRMKDVSTADQLAAVEQALAAASSEAADAVEGAERGEGAERAEGTRAPHAPVPPPAFAVLRATPPPRRAERYAMPVRKKGSE